MVLVLSPYTRDMPSIQFPDPHSEAPYVDEPDFSDMMINIQRPVQDEPEQELSTQERHASGFAGEAYQGPRLGGFQSPGNEAESLTAPWAKPERHKSLYAIEERPEGITQRGGEVCVLKQIHPDKPARAHVVIGRHCPHGLANRSES